MARKQLHTEQIQVLEERSFINYTYFIYYSFSFAFPDPEKKKLFLEKPWKQLLIQLQVFKTFWDLFRSINGFKMSFFYVYTVYLPFHSRK